MVYVLKTLLQCYSSNNPRIENNNIINLCSGDALEYTLEVDPGVSVVSWSRTDTNLVSGTSKSI